MPALAMRFTGGLAGRLQRNAPAARPAATETRPAPEEHDGRETAVPCTDAHEPRDVRELRGAQGPQDVDDLQGGDLQGGVRPGAHPGSPGVREVLGGAGWPRDAACAARLAADFRAVPHGVVRRCLADAGARAEHLGVTAPGVVERLARERLLAMVNSAPPSGAAPVRR